MKINIQRIFLSAQLLTVMLLGHQTFANSMDPISEEEISRAVQSTPATNSNLQGRGVSAPSNDQNLEFLGTKSHRFEKSEQGNGQRWADTLVYDYATDELITTVIDLNTNSVVSVQRSRDMQPPLTENELNRALDIVFEDEEEFSILQAEFKKITGQTLTSKTQLNYKAFTFFADSMPNIVNEASKVCGSQRCAQVLLYTTDRISFRYSPVLNLSAGLVTQRISH